MAKTTVILIFTFLVVGLLAACAPGTDTLAAEAPPSRIAAGALVPATLPPQPSPTLAAPAVTVSGGAAAAPPAAAEPALAADPNVTETAVVPAPTMTPTTPNMATIAAPSYPLPTPAGVYSWTLHVPILMYHYISEPPADADVYRTDLSVTPENFRQQMAYLAENGYTPIDFYQLSAAIAAKTDLPEKPILLTFDDGYLDNYENAFPILQEYGFIGTFFVITDNPDLDAEGYASWAQLEEMAAAGMRIESHTKNHPDLSEMERDAVIYQVLGAQETIAAHIGYTPRYLCYPGGRYQAETMQILAELDLWGAVTTQGGVWHGFDNRFEWSRQRMRHDTTLAEFARLVDQEGTIGGKPVTENESQ